MNFAAPQAAITFQRASFKGNAKEYFGIWIVNILLTIVTLGVYSAWAKVRRNRYFYGNTVLMDHSFDYHAKGIHIFIGRLIALGMFGIYQAAAIASPIAAGVISLLILAVLPWLMARSLRFNLRATSYRNVRFDFVGKAGGAFVALILGSFVAVLSLGLLAPLATRWLNRYIINNIRYGGRPFETSVTLRQIYGAWLLPAIIMFAAAALAAVMAFYVGPWIREAINNVEMTEEERMMAIIGAVYLALIPFLILYYFVGVLYRVAVRNVVLQATLFDGRHGLYSDLGRIRYFWILLSNTLVVLLTLGFMRPWAAVREWRYRMEHTGISLVGDPGEIVNEITATGSAASAEYMDFEGFDFGF